MPKVSLTLGTARCSVFVQGYDTNCPLCGRVVRSGEHHECSSVVAAASKVKKKKGAR